jgi:hypothetical protein
MDYMSGAIAKTSKLLSLLLQSQKFGDEFENEFGKNKGAPALVNMR